MPVPVSMSQPSPPPAPAPRQLPFGIRPGSGERMRHEWFGNVRGDILAGIVVGLALIPESIAFSIIAGVDPRVGLYTSFCMAVVIAFAGGRAGMISSATGVMSLVLVNLVRDHGVQYLFATTLLTGALQVLVGVLGLGSLIRFVSRSVMTGFINSMAILVFLAQVPELRHAPRTTWPLVIIGLIIIYALPRLTTLVPSPLVCIVLLTTLVLTLGMDVRTVSDKGELPASIPTFLLPDVPLTFDTLRIILPYALVLCIAGLMESLLTAALLDEMTDTRSSRNREATGQGIANIVTGFFGGMAGCAIIGQSLINFRSGGRGRLSCFTAGVALLLLVVPLNSWVARIPMAALAAVMLTVAVGSFSWSSLRDLRTHPRSSSLVMITTVAVVVYTHNLAYGVLVGVLLSAIFFTWRVSRATHVEPEVSADGQTCTYRLQGNLFFAAADTVMLAIDPPPSVARVVLDLSAARVWDISGVSALQTTVASLQRRGVAVEITGLSTPDRELIDRLAPTHGSLRCVIDGSAGRPSSDAPDSTQTDATPVVSLRA